jgi:hypothetical protein
MAHTKPTNNPAQIAVTTLAPAFMLSELKRAFEIGFLIFVPFLIIDMAVASILMSMGMMMLPPVIISLPFKLIFFVLVDGWRLIAGSLVQSYLHSPNTAPGRRADDKNVSSGTDLPLSVASVLLGHGLKPRTQRISPSACHCTCKQGSFVVFAG